MWPRDTVLMEIRAENKALLCSLPFPVPTTVTHSRYLPDTWWCSSQSISNRKQRQNSLKGFAVTLLTARWLIKKILARAEWFPVVPWTGTMTVAYFVQFAHKYLPISASAFSSRMWNFKAILKIHSRFKEVTVVGFYFFCHLFLLLGQAFAMSNLARLSWTHYVVWLASNSPSTCLNLSAPLCLAR